MAVAIPLVVAAAGAWAGTAVGIGAAAGWAIGSALGTLIEAQFAPKTAPQNTLSDLSVQTANWGAGLPQIFGAQRVAGNIIWSTDKRMVGGDQGKFGGKGGGGGKGGKKGGGQQAYYEVSMAIALCEGPIFGIKRIWAAGDLIFDDSAPVYVPNYGQSGGSYQQYGSSTSGFTSSGGSSLGQWTLYHGTTDQTPDATIAANGSANGAGGVPYSQMTLQNGHEYTYGAPAFGKLGTGCAYRGIAYIVFPNLYLGYGGSIPPLTFEVVESGALNPISVTQPYTQILAVGFGNATNMVDVDDAGENIVCGTDVLTNGTHQGLVHHNVSARVTTPINNASYSPINGASIFPAWVAIDGGDIEFGDQNSLYASSSVNGGGMALSDRWVETGLAKCRWKINGAWWGVQSGTPSTAYSSSYVNATPYYGAYPAIGVSMLDTGSVGWYNRREAPVINDVMYYIGNSGRLLKFTGPGGSSYVNSDPSVVSPVLAPMFTDGAYLYISSGASTPTIYKCDPFTGIFTALFTLPSLGNFSDSLYFGNASPMLWYQGYLIASWVSGTSVFIGKFYPNGTLKYSLQITDIVYESYDIRLTSKGLFIFGWSTANSSTFGYSILNLGDNAIIIDDIPLPTAVATICNRANFTDIDTSMLNAGILTSFTRPAGSPARDVLSYLSRIYQFDMVDSGGTLKFVPKGQPIVAQLSIDEIGFAQPTQGTPPAPYSFSRAQGADLPRSLTLKYTSRNANYTQTAKRFDVNNPDGKDVTASIPMTLDDATAMNAAMLLCIAPHIEKTAYTWTASFKWASLEPGDVVQLPWGVTRITNVAIKDVQNLPVLEFQGVIDASYVINSGYGMAQSVPTAQLAAANSAIAALPSGSGALISKPIAGSQNTLPVQNKPPANPGIAYADFIEVPPLNSKQTTPFYLAYCYSSGNTFMGAAVFESTDGGTTFNQIGQQAVGGDSGFILELIPATQEFTWDMSTVLSAYLTAPYMTLESATDLQVMNGANLILVGDELIQFVNAVLMTDAGGAPYYQLSRLLRGRRGTEWAMATHIAGERFTLISSTQEAYIDYGITDLNRANQYKVATAGQDISAVSSQTFSPTGVWFMPWAVANPTLVLDSSNNWNLSFVPRARLNGTWSSGVISSLDADTQTWSIDIYSGTTLKRTVTGQLSSPTFQYTAAMQSADGFSAGAHGITFNIYQVGQTIGRGYVKTVTS